MLTHAARAAAKQDAGAFSGTSGGRARRALVRARKNGRYVLALQEERLGMQWMDLKEGGSREEIDHRDYN